MIIRQRGSEILHIGRSRRYDRASAAAILARLATQRGRMGEMRACLALLMPAGQVAALDNRAVLETLATKIASGEASFIWLRPQEANAPEIIVEDQPPVAAAPVKEEPKEEKHWIEIELLSEDPPHEPIAGAKYIIELPDKSIIEGYLDEKGKARVDGVKPGECKVTFPEYADPKKEGDVELEEEPVALPPPKDKCAISKVEVECEHVGDRKKKVVLPIAAGGDRNANVLEVLGAGKDQGDKITVTMTMLQARCEDHAEQSMVIKRPRPAETLTFQEDQATFVAYYDTISLKDRLFPWNLPPIEYKITPVACNAASRYNAIVRVYPAYEISAKIAIALDATERSTEALAKARSTGKIERRGRPAHTDWSLTIEGQIKYHKNSIKLGGTFESKIKQLSVVNRVVKRAIEKFCTLFKDFFGIELELELPNLSLSYEGKFAEHPNALTVGPEWSLKFAADPFFGVTFKADILELIIKALQKFPALSTIMTFLLKARAWAKESGNKLELVASLSGRIGFELSAKRNRGNKRLQLGVQGKGEVVVGLEAAVEASVGVLWVVSFSAGAKISGSTGVAFKPAIESDDEGILLKAELDLLALEFEYGMYASGKFEWGSDNKSKGEAGLKGKHEFWEEQNLWDGEHYVMKYDGAGEGA